MLRDGLHELRVAPVEVDAWCIVPTCQIFPDGDSEVRYLLTKTAELESCLGLQFFGATRRANGGVVDFVETFPGNIVRRRIEGCEE
jgi:hypothetical protein